jgi:hypothetical protein
VSARRILGALLALAIVVIAWRTYYLATIEENPTGALWSVGLGIFCLWTASRAQIGMCLIAGLALRLLAPVHVTYYAGSVIATLGLSGFCGFCLLIYWVASGERKLLMRILLPALIFLTFNVMLTSLLKLAAMRTARRYDVEIYAMDSAVWDGVVAFFGRALATHPWMLHSAEMVYYALPGVMILVFAFYTYRRHDLEINLLGLYLAMGILGLLLYFVVPACGPIYAFGNLFPFALPRVRAAVLASSIFSNAPNAMPSLHFANALMLYWNSKPWRGLRIFTLIFAILTGVATLGSREHYVTDLVVAVPFAVAVQSLFSSASNKFAAVALCTMLIAIWLLAILMVPVDSTPHWLLWALTLGSVGCPALDSPRIRYLSKRPAFPPPDEIEHQNYSSRNP